MTGKNNFPIIFSTMLLLLALSIGGCSKADEEIIELKVLRQNVELRSQADIQSFMAEHKDAKRIAIDGYLIIGMPVKGGESSNITSLEALGKLKEVRKNMSLTLNRQLTSLKGLERLDQVKGSLRIELNGLQQAPELESLALVDSLIILNNPELPSLTELGLLRRINTLYISANGKLESLQGLGGIDSLVNLHLQQNSLLTDLSGLDKIQKISGLLTITSNASLESLSGLGLLGETGAFSITANPALTDMCALSPAITLLLTRHPEASQAELDALMKLQANGRNPYSWEQLLADCQE